MVWTNGSTLSSTKNYFVYTRRPYWTYFLTIKKNKIKQKWGERSLKLQYSPLIYGFPLQNFYYLGSNVVQKHYVENSRNKQFINSKLSAVLSNAMKSQTVQQKELLPFPVYTPPYMLPPVSHLVPFSLQIDCCIYTVLNNGPNIRAVMPTIQMCQREATKCFL